MRLFRLTVAVLLTTLITGAVYFSERGGEAKITTVGARAPATIATGPSAPASDPASLAKSVAATEAIVVKPSPPKEFFAFRSDLEFYQRVHDKVFLSEREQRDRRDLLRDAKLLGALGERLRHASAEIAVIKEQDAALDLLFEALTSGDHDSALAALQGVVRDSQIEATSLSLDARKQLAGIKGEVLFRLSASEPAGVTALTAQLPGPVSRKVWANALKMQQANAELSLAEVRANDQ